MLHHLFLLCVTSFNLLFKVQQGLSVRLQYRVQPCAESSQVDSMKSSLVGLVRVMFLERKEGKMVEKKPGSMIHPFY